MKRNILLVSIFLFFTFSLFGQATAVLEYFDDEYELEIYTPEGALIDDYYFFGMEIEQGSKIVTYNSTVEVRLDPNGSIIKIRDNTEFVIETLQGAGYQANEFTLLKGKIRTIAARAGLGENYSIVTPTAVCGVRGTDFILDVQKGVKDAVIVKTGKVEFRKISAAAGEAASIILESGQMADTFASIFQPQTLAPSQLQSIFEDVTFEKLEEKSVPGHTEEVAAEEEAAAEDEEAGDEETAEGEEETDGDAVEADAEETEEVAAETEAGEEEAGEEAAAAPAEEPKSDSTAPSGGVNAPGPAVADQSSDDAPGEAGTPEGEGPALSNPVLDFLQDVLGFEVGTTTLEGNTYSKVVLQPNFDIGKWSFGLYLPIIYNQNLFDPNDWYRPNGNNEWSFGTDEEFKQYGDLEWLHRTGDVLADLLLKFKYVKYGNNNDNLYFRFGNVDDMTIGTGLIMTDYPNDIDFPAIRKLGLNAGFLLGAFGMELVADDLASPGIMGTRIYLQFGEAVPFQFGISGIADIAPAEYLPTENEAGDSITYGNPIFIGTGIDMKLNILRSEMFSLILFADAGTLLPFFGEAYQNINEGIAVDAIWYEDKLQNFGARGGLFGNIAMVNWRLEYRYYQGMFRPALFNSIYDRTKGQYLLETIDYLNNPVSNDLADYTMGIYGEMGANFFDIVAFEAGYMWPMEFKDGQIDMNANNDFIHMEIGVIPGAFPEYDIHGSLYYDRTNLVPSVIDAVENSGTFEFIDAETVIGGEIVIPIAEVLAIGIKASTAFARDPITSEIKYFNDEGVQVMDPTLGNPKIYPAITIETKIGF